MEAIRMHPDHNPTEKSKHIEIRTTTICEDVIGGTEVTITRMVIELVLIELTADH
jgi:hypothetical protein